MNKTAGSGFFRDIVDSEEFHFEGAKLEFALELQRVMEREKVKKSELAERLGVTAPMVSKLLRGDANVTIETMVKLSRSLGGKLFLKIVREGCTARLFELAQTEPQRVAAHRVTFSALMKPAPDDVWALAANDFEHEGQGYEAKSLAT